jgi:hypothetical protein
MESIMSLTWPNIGNPETFDESLLDEQQLQGLRDAYGALPANPAYQLWLQFIKDRVTRLGSLDYIVENKISPEAALAARSELQIILNAVDVTKGDDTNEGL